MTRRTEGDRRDRSPHRRVAALADPGEVLVTRTVRDLVAGSRIVFEIVASTSSRACPTAGRSIPLTLLTLRSLPYAMSPQRPNSRTRFRSGRHAPDRDQARGRALLQLEPQAARRGRAFRNRPRDRVAHVLCRVRRPPAADRGHPYPAMGEPRRARRGGIPRGRQPRDRRPRDPAAVECHRVRVEPMWWTFVAIGLVLAIDASRRPSRCGAPASTTAMRCS